MSKFLRSMLWLVVLGVSTLGQVFAQGGATGAISGTVQDASGAVVANADVRITNQDTGTVTRVTKTDATGSFNGDAAPGGELYGEHHERRVPGSEDSGHCRARYGNDPHDGEDGSAAGAGKD